MDIFECINNRRSVRTYEERCISEEDIKKLLGYAVQAPTGSGKEPWGFVVINNKKEIDMWSEKIKSWLLSNPEDFPHLQTYRKLFKNDKFSIFHHASTLLIIYGNSVSYWSTYDGSLAAGNLMLAGHAMGIGTCWIGFAECLMDTDEFKSRYHVPENYRLVSTISMGYEVNRSKPLKRKDPVIFNISE